VQPDLSIADRAEGAFNAPAGSVSEEVGGAGATDLLDGRGGLFTYRADPTVYLRNCMDVAYEMGLHEPRAGSVAVYGSTASEPGEPRRRGEVAW
jgi:hypothetical protein